MIQVVLNQGLLGLSDSLLDGLQLLRHIQTRLALFQHGDYAGKVPASSAQPLDGGGMGFVGVHMERGSVSSPRGYSKLADKRSISRSEMQTLLLKLHRPQRKTCLRWLVLLVLIWGTLASSMGLTTSHGLADLAPAAHGATSSNSHGHSHDEDVQVVEPAGGHPHHAADHSHDKAHALPEQLTVAPAPSLERIAAAQPWVPGLEAGRLDRPPKS
jgi:hypothetical protein